MNDRRTYGLNWLYVVTVLFTLLVLVAAIEVKAERTASRNAIITFAVAKQFINGDNTTFKPSNPIGPWMAYYIGESDFDFEGKSINSSKGFLTSSSPSLFLPLEKPETIIFVDAEAIDSNVYDRTTTFTKHYSFSGDSKSEVVDRVTLKQRKIQLWVFDSLKNKLIGHIVIFEKPLSDHYTSKDPITSFNSKMIHDIVEDNFKNDTIYIVK